MLRKTKIICTIGPSVRSYEKILQLIDAGMNIARLNFSHGSSKEHQETIEMLKKARKEKVVPLAIMLDTKGPEIRLGNIKNNYLEVFSKQKILITKEEVLGDAHGVSIQPSFVLDSLQVGDRVLFDDGYIITKVVEISKKGVLVEIENNGVIRSYKGVNVPGIHIDLPSMTEQDIKDILFGCRLDIDVIAASFIRSAEHVLEIKRLLMSQEKPEVLVIAKIENSLGIQNFDAILQVADGIMVARGDLGVELPLNQVPRLQKMMIRKCRQAGKPVITATQMLESMIANPLPTRAEVSDVANAIYDSTSAVMLSGETAAGKYPIQVVQMMKEIAEETEKDFNYRQLFANDSAVGFNDVTSSVALASVKTAYSSHAKGIFVFTNSGFSARALSRLRPEIPIIALTPHVKVYHQLALEWGVTPALSFKQKNIQEAFIQISNFALSQEIVQLGDLVVVVAGDPFGISRTTNTMIVETIVGS
ncbi:MAG TPA: pyruvate kinase [Candidatus Rhabdochlamydia sp.]|jgi:pyruvate kinase|nr:pyruvate kinase [Candidatus Rhabdochlamydia sp.]